MRNTNKTNEQNINNIKDEHELLKFICGCSVEDLIYNQKRINKLSYEFMGCDDE